jgi:hypothetical protein
MKESLSSTAVIEDIEEATFIALCEFGYRGRYRTRSRNDDKMTENNMSAEGEEKSKGPGVHLVIRISNPHFRPDRMESKGARARATIRTKTTA